MCVALYYYYYCVSLLKMGSSVSLLVAPCGDRSRSAMASSEKRCFYEVLELSMDCSADEIRSAYKRLALLRHPDKLVQSGLSSDEATASFQELQNAYQILSDPRERSWYDSHRSQVLFSNPNQSGTGSSSSLIPDLFYFFSDTVYSGYSDSKKGFYKVYSDAFDKVYSAEVAFSKKLGQGDVKEAPLMGNLESPHFQVRAFYEYWLGFGTVMDFYWVDQYDSVAGVNRKSRRVMEDENKKLRKRAKREYNETVRELAAFVKKRDKRVIDMMLKKREEMEKKRQKELERKKQMEKERAEARAYKEPEWAMINEEDEIGYEFNDMEDNNASKEGQELYCVVCGKKFKSEKQWQNHEQSKKHKEKVAQLRMTFENDDSRDNETQEAKQKNDEEMGLKSSGSSEEYEFLDCKSVEFDDLNERFREGLGFEEVNIEKVLSDIEVDCDIGVDNGENDGSESFSGGQFNHSSTEVREEIDVGNENPMEYNRKRSTRSRRRRNKDKERQQSYSAESVHVNGSSEASENGSSSNMVKSSSENCTRKVQECSNGQSEDGQERWEKQKASKGKKQKSSKKSGNTCESCGQEFESRNKLHKHLHDSGHATLRSR